MSMKATEVRRRVAWCVGTAVMLRRVLHWSGERIRDNMPNALDTYMREGNWSPPEGKHAIWAATEGQ